MWRLLLIFCLAAAPAKADGFSAMPMVPSDDAPPPVNSTGSAGTSTQYARADHTHVSSVFKAIKSTTDATGTVSWTYPAGFFPDPPVVEITVETASGQPMVALITSNTASGGTAQVLRAQTLPASLTLLSGLVSFNVFGGTVPVGTKVHVFAGRATQ